MNLYFQTHHGEYQLVSGNASLDNVDSLIRADITRRNPAYIVYYVRICDVGYAIMFDVGSWSEFYYLTDLSAEELYEEERFCRHNETDKEGNRGT